MTAVEVRELLSVCADEELSDHEAAEQRPKELEGLEADDPQFDHLVAKPKLEVSEHVRDEDGTHAPAPLRPGHPPGDKLLGADTGPVDRARDLMTGRDKS